MRVLLVCASLMVLTVVVDDMVLAGEYLKKRFDKACDICINASSDFIFSVL